MNCFNLLHVRSLEIEWLLFSYTIIILAHHHRRANNNNNNNNDNINNNNNNNSNNAAKLPSFCSKQMCQLL